MSDRPDPATRVAHIDGRDLDSDPAFQCALERLCSTENLDREQARRMARGHLESLTVQPRERYLDCTAWMARFMTTRGYERQLDVNHDALEQLKPLAAHHSLIFLWSHKSHLDSFVFLRALYEAEFRPQPLSFAGINMNFAGFGTVARRAGAIFLRRSFRDDPVYRLVVQHYVADLVRLRVPLSWSIEGTRSRTGKLVPPKTGLLQWVVDACQAQGQDDALLVPVAISFDQIPEMDDFIAMQRGQTKRRESLAWFLDYIRKLRGHHGRIYVRFAEPIRLDHGTALPRELLGDSPGKARVRGLAFEICRRIEHIKPINITDLITLVLLSANDRSLDHDQIRQQVQAVLRQVQHRALPASGDLRAIGDGGLAPALDALTRNAVIECFDRGSSPLYRIAPGRQLAAAYYRNTIIHYFLGAAVAELALADLEPDQPEEAFWDRVMSLRDLLKFEFFFDHRERFREEISAYLEHRFPDWRCRGLGDTPPLFGNGMLRSFLEAYWIVANVLADRRDTIVSRSKWRTLVRECLRRGEEMRLRRQIVTGAALSKPLLENALELAAHRGLMDQDQPDLEQRRQGFADQMTQVTAAVNQLQHHYDRALET